MAVTVEPLTLQLVDALVAALEPLRDEVEDIQILPYPMSNPTPPTIDLIPSEPFYDAAAFGINGDGGGDFFWDVRARTTTADNEAGWKLLYRLVDPVAGIGPLLMNDEPLGELGSVTVGWAGEAGVSGFRDYVDDSVVNGRLLGAVLRVRVLT